MKRQPHVYNFQPGEIIINKAGAITLLTYLSEAPLTKSRQRRINVRCKCGKEWAVQVGNVMNGVTLCCGKNPCRTYKLWTEDRRDQEVGYKALLYTYKKHALARNLKFHLSYEEFKRLTTLNCHYCGTVPKQIYVLKKKGTDIVRAGVPVTYNGVDRIDSSGDYTIDNTVPCCKVCNRAKMDMSYADFIEWVKKIYNNLN